MAKERKEEKRTMIAGQRKFDLIRLRKQEFTREFAAWYLLLPQIKDDRVLKESHAFELAEKIEDGVFLGEDVNVATVVIEGDEGKEFKINGQHTCRARQYFGSESIGMKVQHSRYRVSTFEDAADLYAQFDDPDGKRTFDQKAKPKWAAQGLLEKHGKSVLRYATSAIAFDVVGRKANSIKKVKKDARIALPSTEEKFVQFLDDVIGKSHGSHLRKSPVACAIFQCWKKSQSASELFWGRVRDGEGLTKNMPSMKLRDFLIKIAYSMGRGALATRKASFEEIYTKCIYAWNSFRRSEKAAEKGDLRVLRYIFGAKQPLAT